MQNDDSPGCAAPRATGNRAEGGAVERGAQGSESSGGFLSGERRAGERRADEKTGVKREQQQLVGRPFNGAVDVREAQGTRVRDQVQGSGNWRGAWWQPGRAQAGSPGEPRPRRSGAAAPRRAADTQTQTPDSHALPLLDARSPMSTFCWAAHLPPRLSSPHCSLQFMTANFPYWRSHARTGGGGGLPAKQQPKTKATKQPTAHGRDLCVSAASGN
jgi:hypothetical protein